VSKVVDLSMNPACHLACVFCCDHASGKAGMETGEVLRWLERRREEGCDEIEFSGFESARRTDFPEIAAHARALGFASLLMITNGSLLADGELTRRILDAGVTRFIVSFHSHRADLEDRITQVPGTFDRKVQGVRNLLAGIDGLVEAGADPARFEVSANVVIHRINLPHLPATVRFHAAQGIADVHLYFVRPIGFALQRFDEIVPTYVEAVPHVERALAAGREAGIKIVLCETPPCVMSGLLSFRGLRKPKEIADAVRAPGRSVRQGEPRTMWNVDEIRAAKSKGPDCARCAHERECDGVWTDYVARRGWVEFRPVPVSPQGTPRARDASARIP
jgi:cyclic pyranopterin phosphate synthase